MALDVDVALTTVAAVAAELGITPDSTQTARIERLITVASSTVATFLNRGPLGYAEDLEEAPRAYGWPVIRTSRRPVYQVDEILVRGRALEDDEWSLRDDAGAGQITLRGEWPFIGARDGRLIAQDRVADSWTQDPEILKVTYAGGWVLPGQTSVPADAERLPAEIEDAVIQAVVWRYRGTGAASAAGIKSESLQSESTTYQTQAEMLNVGGVRGVPGFPPGASAALIPWAIPTQW